MSKSNEMVLTRYRLRPVFAMRIGGAYGLLRLYGLRSAVPCKPSATVPCKPNANPLGKLRNLWDLREYGVCEP